VWWCCKEGDNKGRRASAVEREALGAKAPAGPLQRGAASLAAEHPFPSATPQRRTTLGRKRAFFNPC